VIHVATELERIGDHAKAIAEISLVLGPGQLELPADVLQEVVGFAESARSMLERSIGAFVRVDAEAAQAIAREDDELDAVFSRLYRELIGRIVREPQSAIESVHVLGVCYNLERISDRVTNVCERTLFKATGRLEELARESESLHNHE
jgi:phosphate transport system protein